MTSNPSNYQPKASHFINGEYVEDKAGTEISVIYPATGKQVAVVHSATPNILALAVSTAHAAQIRWAKTPNVERGRILRKAADIMREKNHELSELETIDTGKPLQETLVADAASGADCLEYFGGMIASDTGIQIPLGQDFAYTRREPLGICVGIGAWNYPIQIASWKAAPALACGNAMIFKPSEVTPLSALKLAEILIQAGLPKGLFNVVQGYGDVGAALTSHDKVDKVSLTGSSATGTKVYASAAAGLKHVTMELGGKSPLIVFDDADIEDAVGGAINGNFYSTGQICTNGTRVFVQESILEAFIARLVERMTGIKTGDPMNEDTNFGPLVSEKQRDQVMNYIQIGKSEGARLVTGGNLVEGDGYFIEATVFADVQDHMTIAKEEIFGPVMSILSFKTKDEVVERANSTQYGLAASVFTKDITRAHEVVADLKAGTCWINTYNLTPVEMPFGGVKQSGLGRENASAALSHYSQSKSVYVAMGPVEAAY